MKVPINGERWWSMCAYMPIKYKAKEDGLVPTLPLENESETQDCSAFTLSRMLVGRNGEPSHRRESLG